MILYLYGPDSYRQQKNLETIIKTYREKYSVFSIDHFNFETIADFSQLKDFCSQTSLFDSKKMAIAKNFLTATKDIAGDIKDFLKQHIESKNSIIILVEAAEPAKTFEFLLESASKVYKFPNLSEMKMQSFIKKESNERKIDIAPDAIKLLAKIFSENTWGVVTELEKLELLKPKKQITAKSLEKLLVYFAKPNLFDFIDAVSKNKTLGQKIPMLENLFLNKEESAKIFNILASRPFIDFKLMKNLADCDVLIKSGKLDYELALLDITLK